jgi:predicted SAM-dependent methyltransferase
MSGYRVNVGCGATPTPGWINFDNSWSVRLGSVPFASRVLASVGVLSVPSHSFISKVREHSIRWADAARHIPLAGSSAIALYSSHMLEHLDPAEVTTFLAEARRVLASGGILRLAVPDLALLASRYSRDQDADAFVHSTLLAGDKPHTLREKLRLIVVGPRHHHWMYDGPSLRKLLDSHGFEGSTALRAGTTTIPDPGELDLFERADESVYVEARRP